jgi:hypothetical protein
MDNNINDSQKKQRPDRHGANNPMWGRHHSDSARLKQKNAAIERNKQYQKWKDSQHHVSMDEFLSNNPTVEQYIKTLVRESIQRYLWNDRRISIPNI